jgi:RND family efflux transporter MFP subunit
MRSANPTAFLACAGLGLVIACFSEEPPGEIVRPVISMTVADVATFRQSTLPGRAKAREEADLAFEVPGKLIERPVNVGDAVRAGQVVAQLDPRDFKNALDRALAAQAQARTFRDRVQQAAKTGAVSRQEVTDAVARSDAANAEVRIRRKALDDATLLAPFDGTVAATYVENRENVLAKQRVVRLLDTSRIEMILSVPESLISLVPIAYDIEVEFDAYPDRKITATVWEISDEASRATRTYPVTVGMDTPEDMDIKPGMAGKVTARADLPADARQAGIEIPLTALFSPPDDPEKRSYVWIVDPDTLQVHRREVSVQHLTARGARVRGLEPGERVVTVGVHHLREGRRVSLSDSSGFRP